MSEKPKKGKAGRLRVRGDLYDRLAQTLLSTVEEMMDERMPTMGTVKGRDGGDRGNVRVRVDDEEDDRSVGFARLKGQTYANGDRVWLAKNKAGDFVVMGGIATGGGAGGERAIGDEQLHDEAVKGRSIGKGVIKGEHLSGDPLNISRNQLDQTLQKDLGDFVKQGSGQDEVVRKKQIDNFATTNQLNGKAEQSQVNGLKDDIDKLKQEIADLKRKSGKKDKKA